MQGRAAGQKRGSGGVSEGSRPHSHSRKDAYLRVREEVVVFFPSTFRPDDLVGLGDLLELLLRAVDIVWVFVRVPLDGEAPVALLDIDHRRILGDLQHIVAEDGTAEDVPRIDRALRSHCHCENREYEEPAH